MIDYMLLGTMENYVAILRGVFMESIQCQSKPPLAKICEILA